MKSQLVFSNLKSTSTHGGELGRGKRKTARPIATKKAMHLVLRSDHARGPLSFLYHERPIRQVIRKQASRFHVQVYELVLNSNHIHTLIRARSREDFKSFLRAIAGLIAKSMMKCSEHSLSHFWTETIFSRIVEWGRAFAQTFNYLIQNELEAHGFIPYQVRRKPKRVKRVAAALAFNYG